MMIIYSKKTKWNQDPIETYIIVSHLFIYCNDDKLAYSLSQWLNNQVISAILVNERTTQSKMSKLIEKYQI